MLVVNIDRKERRSKNCVLGHSTDKMSEKEEEAPTKQIENKQRSKKEENHECTGS